MNFQSRILELENANAVLQRRLDEALQRGLTDYRKGINDGKVVTLNALCGGGDLEKALRQLLIALQAYGRSANDDEQRKYNAAFDAAQDVLASTKDGRQSVI